MYIFKYSVLFKAMVLAIICLFLANDMAFAVTSLSEKSALAPPLAIKPPCKIMNGVRGEIVLQSHGFQQRHSEFTDWVFDNNDQLRSTIFKNMDMPRPGSTLIYSWNELLKNAFDATADRAIEEGDKTYKGKILYELNIDGDYLVLNVIDNGKTVKLGSDGYPLKRLREPVALYEGGAGEGLKVVRDFVNAAGGTITWHPLEQGTRTEMRIPKSNVPNACKELYNSYFIVENEELQRSWDEETVRSVRAGETLGAAFRNRWALADISYLIGQMLQIARDKKLKNPKEILIPLIKKHIKNRNGEGEVSLEGYDIDGIQNVWTSEGELRGLRLPVKRSGSASLSLLFTLDKGEQKFLELAGGTELYLTTEANGEAEAHILDEKIGDLSHDFKNVLQAISSAISYIREYGNNQRSKEICDEMSRAFSGIFELDVACIFIPDYVKKFIAFVEKHKVFIAEEYAKASSKPAMKQMTINNFDISKLVLEDFIDAESDPGVSLNRILDLAAFRNRGKARIEIRCPAEIPDMAVNGPKLFRILLNLVGNATQKGAKNIFLIVDTIDDGKDLLIKVSDDGVGMPPEKVEAFNAERRVESDKGSSGGRGLRIVREKVRECGGTISVESRYIDDGHQDDHGTTFTIRLPIDAPGAMVQGQGARTKTSSMPAAAARDDAADINAVRRAYMMFRCARHPIFENLAIGPLQIWLFAHISNARNGLYGDTVKDDPRFAEMYADYSGMMSSILILNELCYSDFKKANKNHLKIISDYFANVAAFIIKYEQLFEAFLYASESVGEVEGSEREFFMGKLPLLKEAAIEQASFIKCSYDPKQIELKMFLESLLASPDPDMLTRPLRINIGDSLTIQAMPYLLSFAIETMVENSEKAYIDSRLDGDIEVGAFREGDYAVIQVKDHANGIDHQNLSRIFDLDFTAFRSRGTGLGLALVKTIVEDHGGTISVESRHISTHPDDHGTVFTIRLPIAVETSQRHKVTKSQVETPAPAAATPAAHSVVRSSGSEIENRVGKMSKLYDLTVSAGAIDASLDSLIKELCLRYGESEKDVYYKGLRRLSITLGRYRYREKEIEKKARNSHAEENRRKVFDEIIRDLAEENPEKPIEEQRLKEEIDRRFGQEGLDSAAIREEEKFLRDMLETRIEACRAVLEHREVIEDAFRRLMSKNTEHPEQDRVIEEQTIYNALNIKLIEKALHMLTAEIATISSLAETGQHSAKAKTLTTSATHIGGSASGGENGKLKVEDTPAAAARADAAPKQRVDRLILSVALMEHGGPLDFVGNISYLLRLFDEIRSRNLRLTDSVAEVLRETEIKMRAIGGRYYEILHEAENINQDASIKTITDKELNESERECLKLYRNAEKVLRQYRESIKSLQGRFARLPIETEETISFSLPILDRLEMNLHVARGFLNDAELMDSFIMLQLKDWLPGRVWQTKVIRAPAETDSVKVRIKSRAIPPVKVNPELLHIAIERIVSNGFHETIRNKETIHGEQGNIVIEPGADEGGKNINIVISSPGWIDESRLVKNKDSGLPNLLTLDYARPDFSHGIGLPFTAMAIQMMGGKINVRNANAEGLQRVEFTITLPIAPAEAAREALERALYSESEEDRRQGRVEFFRLPEGAPEEMVREIRDIEQEAVNLEDTDNINKSKMLRLKRFLSNITPIYDNWKGKRLTTDKAVELLAYYFLPFWTYCEEELPEGAVNMAIEILACSRDIKIVNEAYDILAAYKIHKDEKRLKKELLPWSYKLMMSVYFLSIYDWYKSINGPVDELVSMFEGFKGRAPSPEEQVRMRKAAGDLSEDLTYWYTPQLFMEFEGLSGTGWMYQPPFEPPDILCYMCHRNETGSFYRGLKNNILRQIISHPDEILQSHIDGLKNKSALASLFMRYGYLVLKGLAHDPDSFFDTKLQEKVEGYDIDAMAEEVKAMFLPSDVSQKAQTPPAAAAGDDGQLPVASSQFPEKAETPADTARTDGSVMSQRERAERIAIALRSFIHAPSSATGFVTSVRFEASSWICEMLVDISEKKLADMLDGVIDRLYSIIDEAFIARERPATIEETDRWITELGAVTQELGEYICMLESFCAENIARIRNNSKREKSGFGRLSEESLKEKIATLKDMRDALENRCRFVRGVTKKYPIDALQLVVDASKFHPREPDDKVLDEVSIESLLDSPISIPGDRITLVNALANIIRNSCVHGKEEGERASVTVRVTRDDTYLNIEVIDKGPGVLPELLHMGPNRRKKLFDLNVTAGKNGTGLGATEAWYAIHDHGGTISVESRYVEDGHPDDHGTTFTIRLPIAVEELQSHNVTKSQVETPPPTAAARDDAAAAPIANPLIDNPCMKNLLARDTGPSAAQFIEKFLDRNHPLKEEVFSRIDAMSDDEILAEADKRLAPSESEDSWLHNTTYIDYLGRNMTLRELFTRPTVGMHDLSQVLLSRVTLLSEAQSINRYIKDGNRNQAIAILECQYLIMKGLEVLSRRGDMVLIRKEDMDAMVDYLSKITGGWYPVSNLLGLADILVPADTPQKLESIKNLLAIVEKLKKTDPLFKEALFKDPCQEKLKALEDALVTSAPAAAAAPADARTSVRWTRLPDWPKGQYKGIPMPGWYSAGLKMGTYLGLFNFDEALHRVIGAEGFLYKEPRYAELTDEPTIGDIIKMYNTSESIGDEITILHTENKWLLLLGNIGAVRPKYDFADITIYGHTHMLLTGEEKLSAYPSRGDLQRAGNHKGYHMIFTREGVSAYSRKEYIPLFVPFSNLNHNMTLSQLYATLPVAAAKIAPESERVYAERFQDMIGYVGSEEVNKQSPPKMVALGTDWMVGYKEGTLHHKALNPLISALQNCGIPFVIGKDEDLPGLIERKKKELGLAANAKVAVLAGARGASIEEELPQALKELMKDESNTVVGVDYLELDDNSYIRLMEMLTMVLKLSIGFELESNSGYITILPPDSKHSIYILVPRAQPLEYEQLKPIYAVQASA